MDEGFGGRSGGAATLTHLNRHAKGEQSMETSVKDEGPVTVVTITGSIDGLTAGGLQSDLEAQLKGGKTKLVLDLAGVEYTSSAGLRTLLAVMKEARRAGGDFRLAAVRPDVNRVLELSGFTSILKLFAGTGEAVASYGQ
jgi:anti-anti-sigma factor